MRASAVIVPSARVGMLGYIDVKQHRMRDDSRASNDSKPRTRATPLRTFQLVFIHLFLPCVLYGVPLESVPLPWRANRI